jgi:ribonucleoside-diphosphate reductase alpha chain
VAPTLFDEAAAGDGGNGVKPAGRAALGPTAATFVVQDDAPSCPDCGAIMIRSGSCYKCLNCGSTSGCS